MSSISMDAPALLKLARSLRESGNDGEAVVVLRQATRAAPTSVEAWAGLGMSLHNSGDLRAAVVAFRKTLELMPTLGSARVVLGAVLRQLGRYEEAAAALSSALEINAENPNAWANLGLVRIDQGRIGEARRSMEKALALDEANAHATIALASLKKAEPDDAAFTTLEILAAGEKISRADHADIHFALGKMFADIGDFDRSFAEYRKANQLQYVEDLFLQRDFNAAAYLSDVEDLCAAPLPDRAAESTNLPGPTPVFILGMPRSGKTLVEQALARHPRCVALGESPVFHDRAIEAGLLPAVVGMRNPAGCDAWGADITELLARDHSERLVTATLTENSDLLPLIARSLPHARVIFCRRDSLDLSLSCYFKDLSISHNYSNQLDAIGLVCRQSERLARHFAAASHLAWADVEYEKLVADPEGTIRRLLDHVGLDFDERCLPPATGEIDIEDLGPARSVCLDGPISGAFVGLNRNYEGRLLGLMTAVGDSEGAIRRCRAALETNPEDVEALAGLGRGLGIAGQNDEARQVLDRAVELAPADPLCLAARARFIAAEGDVHGALADYWRALSIRPYSLEMPRLYAEMKECVHAVDPDLGRLHDEIAAVFRRTRQMFGAFGVLYQAFEALMLPGSRPSVDRYGIYRLDEVINDETRVLDIGCNAGFMALLCAEKARHVDAFDVEKTLVDIGKLVRTHLNVNNVNLFACGFHDFKPDKKYDLILSFAVHRWIGMPMAEYAALLRGMLAENGVVVFESQGQRSAEDVEPDFDAKARCLVDAGLEKMWQGELTDDGLNRRRFFVLRKTGVRPGES